MTATAAITPSRAELTDSIAAFSLVLLGILGYRTAFGGTTYLLFGALGAVLGLLLAHFSARTRQPVIAAAVASVVLAMLLGGLVLRDTAVAGVLPSGKTAVGLSTALVSGWKELLTTVRPIGSARHLLALPYLLGLTAAVTSAGLSRRRGGVALPLLPPALLVALSILFGGPRPSAAFLQGCVFCAIALGWIALRTGRGRVSLAKSSQRLFRLTAAVAVLAVTAVGAWVLGPHMPLAGSRTRTIAHVQPPLDPAVYGSPLGEYRRFTKSATTNVVDRVLFHVAGAADGMQVRMATLDDFDGLVWSAANRASSLSPVEGFAQIGSRLPASGTGRARDVTITVGPAANLQPWLPTAGVPQAITFGGPRAAALTASLRYNLETSTGLLPVRLHEGDRVLVSARKDALLSEKGLAAADPDGAPTVTAGSYEGVRAAATKFSEGATRPMERVLAIARKLRAGSYSDGLDSVPSDPGHGLGRLSAFVQAPELVGDDEQYAAAMALMANAVGVPARVVLRGGIETDGTVKGRDVRGAVELRLAGHGWVVMPTGTFTPPRDKRPHVQPQQQLPEVPPKVVPPPLQALLSSSSSASDAQTSRQRAKPRAQKKSGFSVPHQLVTAAQWGGPPLLLVLLVVGTISGLKLMRRRRRRRVGAASTRLVNGWAEVLDTARDLGLPVTARSTRREQASALSTLPLSPLARSADAAVFGPDPVEEAAVEDYWTSVLQTRKSLLAALPRWHRIRVLLSLRSFFPRSSDTARAITVGAS